jgi:hypothetical protein
MTQTIRPRPSQPKPALDIRLHRAAERKAMRGLVLSLAALLGSVILASLLAWIANVWLAGRGHGHAAPRRSGHSERVRDPGEATFGARGAP